MRYFCGCNQKEISFMSTTLKSTLWWIFAVIFTLIAAQYQKMTGPTYPVMGSTMFNNKVLKYEMIRTAENDNDAKISITIPDTAVKGEIIFKRYLSNDSLTTDELSRSVDTTYDHSFSNFWKLITKQPRIYKLDSNLVYMMPKQPAAGKMMYKVILKKGSEQVTIGKKEDFVVMRFKGPVPLYILLPHILFMFLGLLFSTRTAIEALIKGAKTYKYAIWTLIFLIPGGLILGPMVQKYAFGAYWTGWPFGHDLTDNKTLVMVLAWAFTIYKLKKDPKNRTWPVAAAIIVLVVYLIPHSVLGSQIDYTKQPK
jgi:hypothetical protein